ncbi:hypothetical protein R6Q57_018632 [Mikania cordata]
MSIEEKKHAENPKNEKLGFVRDGAIKLPPGFRFQPTDQEIVFQYLLRKVFSCPLPASIIPEIINICNFNPWDLPGELEQERYFFSKKEAKYGHGNRVNRKSGDGYWKATGFDKHITKCCNNNNITYSSRKKYTIVGMKKTLVFYKTKPSTNTTRWIMHEYQLLTSPTTTSNDKQYWIPMGNWVLCHVLLNKRSRISIDNPKRSDSREQLITNHRNFTRNDTVLIDCDEASSCSSSSSCGSSVVTHEVSSSRTLLDFEEIN